MKTLKTVTDVATLPARAAGHAAAATLGTTVGAATFGLRATGKVVGWAVGRAAGARTHAPASPPPGATTRSTTTTGPSGAPVPAPATTAPETTVPEVPAPSAPTPPAPAAATPARPAPAGKSPARKSPAKKSPARKKAPSKKAAVLAPALGLSEAEVQDELRTPSGIPAAGEGFNPDTGQSDLHQPDTEPLMDPSTVKAAASELETMRRAADTDKG